MEAGTSQAAAQPKNGKFPCLKCKKNVSKAGVRCNTCYLWVHTKCQQISKELYGILRNPGKYGGTVTWNCDSCAASALDKRMTALESRFQEVEDRVVRNEVAVLEVDKRMDRVEKRQDKVEDMITNERERLRRERVEEMRERELRKRGGGGPQQRGGGGPQQRGGAIGRLLPPTAGTSQSSAGGGGGGVGEREQLIELVRGGMLGGRTTRINSKRTREGDGSDEERVPPTQPQPTPAVM